MERSCGERECAKTIVEQPDFIIWNMNALRVCLDFG